MNYFQKKKLAFMSIVNRVKGFVRTVTGVLPLTLANCVDEDSIIDYTLYGESVQNGTPTPDTPIEVESVGKKTTNLINWDLILSDTTITKVENGYYSNTYAHFFNSTSNIVKHLKSVLKPEVTYTLSRVCVPELYVNGAAIGRISIKANSTELVTCTYWGGLKYVTFTLTQEQIDSITSLDMYFYEKGSTLSKLQLTESDTVLPYEPYGYKIPITVSGKNLFDKSGYSYTLGYYNDNGEYAPSSNGKTAHTNNYSQVKPNTTYHITELYGYSGITLAVYFYDKDKQWLSRYKYVIPDITVQRYKGQTFITPNECKYVRFQLFLGTDTFDIPFNADTFQFELGDVSTDYEPYHEPITTNIYLDEPLRKIGDYADYVGLENGKVVRNIGNVLYSGAMTLTTLDDGRIYTDVIESVPMGDIVKIYPIISNITNRSAAISAMTSTNFTGYGIGISDTRRIHIKCQTVEEASILKANIESGEMPIDAYFALAEPTETPITLPPIPTFKGTSIISADTTIQPSNAEITYYSNVKE